MINIANVFFFFYQYRIDINDFVIYFQHHFRSSELFVIVIFFINVLIFIITFLIKDGCSLSLARLVKKDVIVLFVGVDSHLDYLT